MLSNSSIFCHTCGEMKVEINRKWRPQHRLLRFQKTGSIQRIQVLTELSGFTNVPLEISNKNIALHLIYQLRLQRYHGSVILMIVGWVLLLLFENLIYFNSFQNSHLENLRVSFKSQQILLMIDSTISCRLVAPTKLHFAIYAHVGIHNNYTPHLDVD